MADDPKSAWPEDWPEDAKTGPNFLAQLLRRYPDRVQVGSLEEGQKWLDDPLRQEKKERRA